MIKAKLNQKQIQSVSISRFKSVSIDVLEFIDTPFSLSLALRLRHGEIDSIFKISINPDDYLSPHRFNLDSQALALFKKIKIPGLIKTDLIEVAKNDFYKSEDECKRTNERFRKYWSGSLNEFPRAGKYLHTISQKITNILGPVPNYASLHFRFGPGSTFSRRGLESTLVDKLSEERPSCSDNLVPFLSDIFESAPLFLESLTRSYLLEDTKDLEISTCAYNRFVTVPKDVTKDRGICVEPSLNIFAQLGIGGFLRKRLYLKRGIDLNNAFLRNRRLARKGSIDGTFATIDLSRASDTVSHNLILELLPIDWVIFLDSCRSNATLIDGKIQPIQKWSSMGNGYTFELETIIFQCICDSVCEDLSSNVFGDDICCQSLYFDEIVAVLTDLGFTPNPSKSFGPTSRFRESCGEDFHHGVSVRPLFLKIENLYHVDQLYRLANYVRDISRDHYLGGLCDSRLRSTWYRILSWIPKHLRCFGPAQLGDSVIKTDLPHWSRFSMQNYGTTRVYALVFKSRLKNSNDPFTSLACGLLTGKTSSPIRGKGKYFKVKLHVTGGNSDVGEWSP